MIYEWKEIECFKGLYWICQDGIVKNKHGRYLKLQSNGLGYLFVRLYKDGKVYKFYIHRLVAKYFIPNPDNKPCVNHLNGLKHINYSSNLEWVTHKENQQHAYKTGITINRLNIPVNQFTLDGKLINSFTSRSEASRETGISVGNISEVINGHRKTAGNYIWKNFTRI